MVLPPPLFAIKYRNPGKKTIPTITVGKGKNTLTFAMVNKTQGHIRAHKHRFTCMSVYSSMYMSMFGVLMKP